MKKFTTMRDTSQWILKEFSPKLFIATPLGLGKPNQLLNEVYDAVKSSPELSLEIFTALSLQIPTANSDLEKRFLNPFKARHFGKNYPELHYTQDADRNQLPKNISVSEFYFQAAKNLYKPCMQKNYISLNYTHVAQAVLEREVPVLLQLIAKHPTQEGLYSLSCNPDLTLDLVELYRKNGRKMKVVGVVHPDLPYIGSDAEVSVAFFEAIVESPEVNHELFALPRDAVSDEDFMIGLQASLLVEDGGTLQVGIGSLSDALVYCILLRHQQNDVYRKMVDELLRWRPLGTIGKELHVEPFSLGLYGTSEMVMDAFMHLRKGGVLKREVKELDENRLRYLHGAFFLGSKDFYEWMRKRYEEGDEGLAMTRVSMVNDLYDSHELAIRRQRVKARFFNMCMQATLLGGVASETLENGQVLSGVGGQYNFVSMSHELPDSTSALLLKSSRVSQGKKCSNLVWGHLQLTIPRHLRDVVITENGIAFIKARRDEEVIQSMLNLADPSFQEELRQLAVKNGKLSEDYSIPEWARNQSTQNVKTFLKPWKAKGYFNLFPFGSDFTETELKLLPALSSLKNALDSTSKLVKMGWRGMRSDPAEHFETLERMGLYSPKGIKEKIYQKLLLGAMKKV